MNEFPDGWWPTATRRDSPNYDPWPPGAGVDMLVIHAISLPPAEFGGPFIDALFRNQLSPTAHPTFPAVAGLRVSAHFVIDRGGRVRQYVPITARAWHAGVSRFAGAPACNDRAIGIELEGAESCAFASVQYDVLVDLSLALWRRFPAISLARILGHEDISPGRKTDPGPHFDWVGYRAALLSGRRRAYQPGAYSGEFA